jgi:hypothetical protein
MYRKPNYFKKQLLGALLTCLSITSIAQFFHKPADSKEIQDLQANGLTYVKTGTEELDNSIEESLKKYWKCTAFKIVDPKTTTAALSDAEIVISANKIKNYYHTTDVRRKEITYSDAPEHILCLYYARELKMGKEIQKGNIIGYISSDGFNQGADLASLELYMPYLVSGLNDCFEKIIRQQLTGSLNSLNNATANAINTNVPKLQKKTLLIIDNTIGHVNTADLDKNGIKYLFLSRADFQKSMKDYETDAYCLLYRSEKLITTISIFEMLDKSLMYTCSYETKPNKKGINQLDDKDIKKIIEYYTSSK